MYCPFISENFQVVKKRLKRLQDETDPETTEDDTPRRRVPKNKRCNKRYCISCPRNNDWFIHEKVKNYC